MPREESIPRGSHCPNTTRSHPQPSKQTMHSSISILVLLLLSSLLLSSAAASSTPDAVRDVDGDELRRGQLYYAMSAITRAGAGGLKLAAALNESCPLHVTKAPFFEYLGEPLAFFPENSEDDTVRVGYTLYALFAEPTRCPESTMWKLENNLVTTGGTTSSAIGTHNSRFAIVKAEAPEWAYQFRPCPCSVGAGASCRMACGGYLGIVEREAVRLLGENNESPHRVVFAKVKPGMKSMKFRSKA